MAQRYEVELTRQAEKDLRKLRSLQNRVVDALPQLETDPHQGHLLKGSLRGCRALELSGAGGAYRAVYVLLPEQRVVLVFMIGAHEGLYEEAERRVRSLNR